MDVYDAIPTSVTTFVAIIPKISLFIFFLELVHYAGQYMVEFSWTTVILISSLLSLIIGTTGGLVQHRIKRLFAYSTISHVGFLLLALAINSIESIHAFLFYLFQYSLSNLNIFFIVITIGYFSLETNKYTNNLMDEKNSPIQLISQLKGFFHVNPMLAISLAVTIFSFAGIPPFVGFFAKQMILSAALQSGYIFLSLVAILTSVISAAYYLGLIKTVFFDKSDNLAAKNLDANMGYFTLLSPSLSLTISVLTLMILLFMVSPQEWLSMAGILALSFFNP